MAGSGLRCGLENQGNALTSQAIFPHVIPPVYLPKNKPAVYPGSVKVGPHSGQWANGFIFHCGQHLDLVCLPVFVVRTLRDTDFQEICTFKLLNGTEDSRPRSKMIHHCMNHSTYHRGQIVTMARNFGLTDTPSTDYMKYVRIK